MTAALFDLGIRLRAADTGRVQPRLAQTPWFPVGDPVAVLVQGRRVTVHPAGGAPRHADGHDGIALLTEAYERLVNSPADAPPRWPTLIVRSSADLDALHRLARQVPFDHPARPVGALVDWWSQRSEHPGNNAVVTAIEHCRTRWATGQPPEDENDLSTWLRWLGIDAPGPTSALLAVADRLWDGERNPILERVAYPVAHAERLLDEAQRAFADALASTPAPSPKDLDKLQKRIDKATERLATARTRGSYDDEAAAELRDRHTDGIRWTANDTPVTAAIGMASREGAESGWERCLMHDPIGHQRARYSGKVMHGTISTGFNDGLMSMATTDNCRYRPGDTIALTVTDRDGTAHTTNAEVMGLAVNRAGLTIRLRPTGRRKWYEDVTAGWPVVAEPGRSGIGAPDRDLIARNYKAAGWTVDPSADIPQVRRADMTLFALLAIANPVGDPA